MTNMNIKILDSHLREYLKTNATPKLLADTLSLSSVSVEKIEPLKNDYLYDIEMMTSRIDLASVIGIAREAATVLSQAGIAATYRQPILREPTIPQKKVDLKIINDEKLVNRVCAVVMDVEVGESPKIIKERLEASDIRSLNNVIDVTNYVMRTVGHPTHVFDFDRIPTHKIVIREAKKGETITTLDKKTYVLAGGDIVADNGTGEIIDLLGIMGLENSVVTNETKRIIFFIDNNETSRMRKTSMTHGIRTEAVQINEKGVDPELAYTALLYGIKLFQEVAGGKVISDIIDIYPNKPKKVIISITEEKINNVIGVQIPLKKSVAILEGLGCTVSTNGKTLSVTVPSWRAKDMALPEDVIEEIARVYGYQNIPSELPPLVKIAPVNLETNPFYWEGRVRHALKYWGFTEVYTYSMVSEELYDGPIESAVTIANPLNEEFVYMRSSLILSLLNVTIENKQRDSLTIFEIANVYHKNKQGLPTETQMLAGIIKKPHVSFFAVKGLLEQIAHDLGIHELLFKSADTSNREIIISVGKEVLGTIEILDEMMIDFELNFEKMVQLATRKKVYTPLSKFPPIIEDLAMQINDDISTGAIIEVIKKQSTLIKDVSLLDKYKATRTFHIIYQDVNKNLTSEEVAPIRLKISTALQNTFDAKIKE